MWSKQSVCSSVARGGARRNVSSVVVKGRVRVRVRVRVWVSLALLGVCKSWNGKQDGASEAKAKTPKKRKCYALLRTRSYRLVGIR